MGTRTPKAMRGASVVVINNTVSFINSAMVRVMRGRSARNPSVGVVGRAVNGGAGGGRLMQFYKIVGAVRGGARAVTTAPEGPAATKPACAGWHGSRPLDALVAPALQPAEAGFVDARARIPENAYQNLQR